MALNTDAASLDSTTTADNSALKRKREDTISSTTTSTTRSKQLQNDLLQVLEGYAL